MQAFILSLISAALAVAILSILSPSGSSDGIAKHVRLLSSLFLICVMLAPVKEFITGIQDVANGTLTLPELDIPDRSDTEELLQSALDGASKEYFVQSLTLLLEEEFGIATGNARCVVKWAQTEDGEKPETITVILSGNAIWKDPSRIEAFTKDLLGCECVTAIE